MPNGDEVSVPHVEIILRDQLQIPIKAGTLKIINIVMPVTEVTPDGAKAKEWAHTGEITITLRGERYER